MLIFVVVCCSSEPGLTGWTQVGLRLVWGWGGTGPNLEQLVHEQGVQSVQE